MTREDIIRMALEAGLHLYVNDLTEEPYALIVERFAALVAASERNKVAQWMMARGFSTGHGDSVSDLLTELEWQIREQERDACAKVCEEMWLSGGNAAECADAIIERGMK